MESKKLEPKKMFLVCAVCGKRLLERTPNGFFHFVFGKKKDKDGVMRQYTPVDILIHGSVQMRCMARDCGHINTFHYFPNIIGQSEEPPKQEGQET